MKRFALVPCILLALTVNALAGEGIMVPGKTDPPPPPPTVQSQSESDPLALALIDALQLLGLL